MAPKKKIQKRNKKKPTKPKSSVKKASSAKSAASKKPIPKKAASKKKPAAKKSKARTKGKNSELFEPKMAGTRRAKPAAQVDTSELTGANEEGAEELLDDGSVFEVEIVEGVEDVSDADLTDLKNSEVPDDDPSEEY